MEQMESLINDIKAKLQANGQDPENYLRGLKHNRAINYWEYIQVDTLLSLQNPRTNFKDETIFIMYHQITELVLKLIRHELDQLCLTEVEPTLFVEKLYRMVRYTDLLSSSFSIMNQGMSYEDYNQFRLSLSPASGFQSAQFRFIELMCTDVDLLIHEHFRKNLTAETTLAEKFDFVYWQEAGYNRETKKKNKTLSDFETKYMGNFIQTAVNMKDKNLNQKYKNMLKNLDQTGQKIQHRLANGAPRNRQNLPKIKRRSENRNRRQPLGKIPPSTIPKKNLLPRIMVEGGNRELGERRIIF